MKQLTRSHLWALTLTLYTAVQSNLLDTLTLEEQIGQLCVAAIGGENLLGPTNTPLGAPLKEVIRLAEHGLLGGIIFLGSRPIREQARLTALLQQKSKYPLLVIQDLEWGLGMRLTDGISYPRALTLGALADTTQITRMAQEIGRQARELGVHVNLAPVVDITTAPLNPVIGFRSFGSDPAHVTRCAQSYIQGLRLAGITPCIKHFPGHGDTLTDSHKTLPVIPHPAERLYSVELVPFSALIQQGIEAIMPGHLLVPAWDDTHMTTLSPTILQHHLRQELGFHGLIISDALNMGALPTQTPGELALGALRAGNQILLCCPKIDLVVQHVSQAVRAGLLPASVIHEAFQAIKALKITHGLDRAHPQVSTDPDLLARINIPEAYQLHDDLYRAAITVVRDRQHLIPLDQSNWSHIDIPAHQSKKHTQQVLDAIDHAQRVVIYLHGLTRRPGDGYFGLDTDIRALVAKMANRGVPTIVVVFGVPLTVPLFDDVDTLIIAYDDVPATHQAVRDVLKGTLKATGTLPVTFPDTFHVGAQRTNLYLPYLKGKRVALMTHDAAVVDPDTGKTTLELLLDNKINIVKLFTPEHGLQAHEEAGKSIAHHTVTVGAHKPIPVISLYRREKKLQAAPDSKDFDDIDWVVYDLQDIGVRCYTYLSSLQYLMQACAQHHKPLIVLDRPNPHTHYVDGPTLLPKHRSFVGLQPVPLVYGMTIGEYARMLNGQQWLENGLQCPLIVIPCAGYTRGQEVLLRPPSPNLPNRIAQRNYPSLCLSEGTRVSIGRGTDLPFQQWGFPGAPASHTFTPRSVPAARDPLWKNKPCMGQLFEVPTGSDHIDLSWLLTSYHTYPDQTTFFTPFFTLLAGTPELQAQIQQGKSEDEIRASWQPELDTFRTIRAHYLIYP